MNEQLVERAPSGAPAWSREQWERMALSMLRTARRYASPRHARITYPGSEGGYGHAVDGLEGFARTFLVAGFLAAGNRGDVPEGTLEWFAEGIAAGTDPDAAPDERWVRLTEHGQAKVEAASLALVLDLTRPWLWDRLDPQVQRNVIDYLAPVVGDDTYPPNNWLWFRIVVQTFLRSVGGPFSLEDIAADLARYDSYAQTGGWYTDGPERAYDHYIGWAMHLYPTLWARMAGAQDLAAERADADRAALDAFLGDVLALVGGDGGPLIQGRSLIYRYAAAAPYWIGAIAGVESHDLGQLRAAAGGIVGHFVERGAGGVAPGWDDDAESPAPEPVGEAGGAGVAGADVPADVLSMGWFGPWREVAQTYSGPSSPYWATKGLVGLILPAEHPVWSAEPMALPVAGGVARYAAAPAWAISGTAADGIVRIANHGSDHAMAGAATGDSPLYARLGYSTATFPLLDPEAWLAPLDQSVVLVDGARRRSHRTAMTPLAPPAFEGGASDVVTAASLAHAHWMEFDDDAGRVNHGSGYAGLPEAAGDLLTLSVLRGEWEVRLVRVADASPAAASLEAGGWVVAGEAAPAEAPVAGADPLAPSAALASEDVAAALVALTDHWTSARIERRRNASPLGEHAAVAVLTAPAVAGWHGIALELTRPGLTPGEPPRLALTNSHARIAWADGQVTTVTLPTTSRGTRGAALAACTRPGPP